MPSECLLLLSADDLPMLRNFARINTPTVKAVKQYLEHVAALEPDAEGYISVSLYHLAEEIDTQEVVLNLMAASLELDDDKGFLRASNARYTKYEYILGDDFASRVDRSNRAERVLLAGQQTKLKWTHVRACSTLYD